MKRLVGVTLFAFIVIIGLVLISFKVDHVYLLPQGYAGWVEVIYEQPDHPPLKQQWFKKSVYEIPPSGTLKTSSKNKTGIMQVYYVGDNGKKQRIGENENFIHGINTSSGDKGKQPDGTSETTPQTVRFFVGTTEQWEQSK
jgi:hypothetical protein